MGKFLSKVRFYKSSKMHNFTILSFFIRLDKPHQEQEVIGSVEEELNKIPNRFMAGILRIIVYFGENRIKEAVRERQQRLGPTPKERQKNE